MGYEFTNPLRSRRICTECYEKHIQHVKMNVHATLCGGLFSFCIENDEANRHYCCPCQLCHFFCSGAQVRDVCLNLESRVESLQAFRSLSSLRLPRAHVRTYEWNLENPETFFDHRLFSSTHHDYCRHGSPLVFCSLLLLIIFLLFPFWIDS